MTTSKISKVKGKAFEYQVPILSLPRVSGFQPRLI